MTPDPTLIEQERPRCKMPDCGEPVYQLGVCLHHWEWLNGSEPAPTLQGSAALPSEAVTPSEQVLRFLERGFRNIDLPPLSGDDLRDIAGALDAMRATTPTAPDQQEGVPCGTGSRASHEASISVESSPEASIPNACEIPPEGWWCSREAGHEGPCAAREVTPPWYAKLIADLRSPPYWSAEYGPGDTRLDISPRHASDALEITVAALQAVKRVALACEGASYDLILSYADNALRARPSCGFWLSASAIDARQSQDGATRLGPKGESAAPQEDAQNG